MSISSSNPPCPQMLAMRIKWCRCAADSKNGFVKRLCCGNTELVVPDMIRRATLAMHSDITAYMVEQLSPGHMKIQLEPPPRNWTTRASSNCGKQRASWRPKSRLKPTTSRRLPPRCEGPPSASYRCWGRCSSPTI